MFKKISIVRRELILKLAPNPTDWAKLSATDDSTGGGFGSPTKSRGDGVQLIFRASGLGAALQEILANVRQASFCSPLRRRGAGRRRIP